MSNNSRYPADKHPVLAFTGAPANFPVQQGHVALHKYLQWSKDYEAKRDQFIHDNIEEGRYIGIHLRLGSDFVRLYFNIRVSFPIWLSVVFGCHLLGVNAK